MRYSNEGSFRRQFNFLRHQFLQDGDLPFTDVLSCKSIGQAMDKIEFAWNDRIYTPLVTLWVFLGQVLSADHSCRDAVARLIVHRISRGLRPCSSLTGAYCQARKRLPEQFFSTIARLVGRNLEVQSRVQWLWKGRHVYMFDGTTVLMPDTAANQKAYPQTWNQKAGAGLPLARVAAVFSLSCGAILDLGIAKYAGKGQGEVSLLHKLSGIFSPGDILLTDALMCNWRVLYSLQQRGVDSVTRLNKALRKADFRCGKRLGKYDHIVSWPKPSMRDIDRETYKSMPEYITVREVRVSVEQPGFRTETIVIVTTLLDPTLYTKQDLADLYRQRWSNELDLRSVKTVMQMECLRCKTPELVRKEIWTHVLAYNLIRTIIAQAASKHGLPPRWISFKGTLQTLEAFQPMIAMQGHHAASSRWLFYEYLLDAIVKHRVADRPDRIEPRRIKRRHKHYVPLSVPRAEAKRQILKGLAKN
jgi:Transposase DDE domain